MAIALAGPPPDSDPPEDHRWDFEPDPDETFEVDPEDDRKWEAFLLDGDDLDPRPDEFHPLC